MTPTPTREQALIPQDVKPTELLRDLELSHLPIELGEIIEAARSQDEDNPFYTIKIIAKGDRTPAGEAQNGRGTVYELKIEKARKPEKVTTAEIARPPTVFLIIEQAEDHTTLRQATVVLALTQTEDNGNIHQTIKPWLPENIHSLLKQELQNAPSRITANNEHLTPHGGTIQIIMEFGPGGPYYTVHVSLYLIDEKRPSTPPQPFQKSITLLPSATETQVQATDDTPEQAG